MINSSKTISICIKFFQVKKSAISLNVISFFTNIPQSCNAKYSVVGGINKGKDRINKK